MKSLESRIDTKKRNEVVSGEASDKMASTTFEVIGVLGADKIGIRHYRRQEIMDNLDYFDRSFSVTRMHRSALHSLIQDRNRKETSNKSSYISCLGLSDRIRREVRIQRGPYPFKKPG